MRNSITPGPVSSVSFSKQKSDSAAYNRVASQMQKRVLHG